MDVCPPGQASLRDFTEAFKSCDPLAAKDAEAAAAADASSTGQHERPAAEPRMATKRSPPATRVITQDTFFLFAIKPRTVAATANERWLAVT